MDGLFEEIDCRSKSDALVMTLLRSAMDKAHENVQSQNGPIEFLHKRSKFYELAAILVDGGLSIVQEEADILETSREKMLSDLTEIKDWLQGRIEEMQLLIIEKDKELVEREENELKLRHALELNERELVYLQEKLEFERMKSQDTQDFITSNQESEDESQGGDICELKNSVDQQVLSIKQKLEDERKSSTRRRRASISCTSDNELYSQFLENNRHAGSELMESVDLLNHFSGIKRLSSSLKPGKNNAMIQQMSSDIDILKGTLDLAFGRMQNAEVFPLEKQWKWSIEWDMLLVSLNGFIIDIQERFEAEFEKRDCFLRIGFCREKWKEFINEMTALYDELKALCSQIKIEEKQSDMQEMSVPPSLQRTTSEPLPDFFFKPLDRDPDPSGCHYVAKLVKNHESFIQKQREREEWNWMQTREILRRKGSSSMKKGKDPDELDCRIQKAIKVLERLIKWDDNLGEDKNCYYNTNIMEESTKKIVREATKNMNGGSDVNLGGEMRKLRQERADLELQILIKEEIYLLVFRRSMKSLQVELFNYKKGNRIKDDNRVSMADVEDDHGVTITDNLPSDKVGKLEEETAPNFLQHYLESSIREKVYEVYFVETITAWKMQMECKADDCLLEEEICRIVLNESIKCIEGTGKLVRSRLKMEIEGSETIMANLSCSNMFPETVGSILKEDIYAVYLRELFLEWRTEKDALDIDILIREDIYLLFMVEMMKEFLHATVEQSGTSERMKYYEDVPSPTELDIPAGLDIIDKLDSFSGHRKVKTVSKSGLTMKHTAQCDEMPEHNNMERTSSTASEKVETSVRQLLKSNALVADKEHKSGMTIKDSKADDHPTQMGRIKIESEREHGCCQREQNDDLQQNISISQPLMEFQQAFMDFEQMAHKKLESNCLRVDKLKHQINALAQPAASLRKKKLLYKKAFMIRCHNLSLAETEVDLLGDKVDKLLCLLQNIYLLLHQNSAVLSQYFGVFDILRWIKKELAEGSAFTTNLVTTYQWGIAKPAPFNLDAKNQS